MSQTSGRLKDTSVKKDFPFLLVMPTAMKEMGDAVAKEVAEGSLARYIRGLMIRDFEERGLHVVGIDGAESESTTDHRESA